MGDAPTRDGLRILTADEDQSTLEQTQKMLEELGHTVTAKVTTVAKLSDLIAAEDPDLSVVVVDNDDAHALNLIEEIAEFARGPIIALVSAHDPSFVSRAA